MEFKKKRHRTEMSQPETTLDRVLSEIATITGFDAREYRPTTLKRRLELRLSATRSKNYRDYLVYLNRDPSESYKFLDTLFITVTDFFRDRGVFSYLEKRVLPDMIEDVAAEKGQELSVWSIGCSKGQEPYSLAMILDLVRRRKRKGIKISILATDVSEMSLKEASLALYKRSEMKNIPQKYKKKFFKKKNNDNYRVIDSLRKMVKFKHHDLIRGGSAGKFHLISCRNVFIFFTAGQQNIIFRKLHSSLNERGILVLGTAETPKEERLFQCISSANHLYQKVPLVKSQKGHS